MLDLSGNPIQCSCETLEFLRWMWDNNANLKEFEKMFCIFNGSTVAFDRLFSYILVHLQFQCSTNLITIVAATLLSVAVVAVVISAFLYRHRWDIRYGISVEY